MLYEGDLVSTTLVNRCVCICCKTRTHEGESWYGCISGMKTFLKSAKPDSKRMRLQTA